MNSEGSHRSNAHLMYKNYMFISFIQPYQLVTVSTISHWIKAILSESGVDPSFSAHLIRGAQHHVPYLKASQSIQSLRLEVGDPSQHLHFL